MQTHQKGTITLGLGHAAVSLGMSWSCTVNHYRYLALIVALYGLTRIPTEPHDRTWVISVKQHLFHSV